LAMPSMREHFHNATSYGPLTENLQFERGTWDKLPFATSVASIGWQPPLVVTKPRFLSFDSTSDYGANLAKRPMKVMQTDLDKTKMPRDNEALQTMPQGQNTKTVAQEEELLRNAQERVDAKKVESEFEGKPMSDSNDPLSNGPDSDMPNSDVLETRQDGGKQMKMEDLVAALREADTGEMPETIQLEPSIETVVKEAGPEMLGRSIDDVSQALHSLSKQANENLSPERIAAMTAQDAPQMLTPVARSLHSVLRSTSLLRHRLASIAEASDGLLSRAEARGNERLKFAEAAVHKADKENEEPADQENCPNIGGTPNNGDAPNQDTQMLSTRGINQTDQIQRQMMPLWTPVCPVREAVVRRKPHDTQCWSRQHHARLQRLQRQSAADFL